MARAPRHDAPVLVVGDAHVRPLLGQSRRRAPRGPGTGAADVRALARSVRNHAADLFAPDPAAQFTVKARRIATSLQLALFHRLGMPPDGLPPRGGEDQAHAA